MNWFTIFEADGTISAIINLNHVVEIVPLQRGAWKLVYWPRDVSDHPVSRMLTPEQAAPLLSTIIGV